jgi:hypothetical protein
VVDDGGRLMSLVDVGRRFCGLIVRRILEKSVQARPALATVGLVMDAEVRT